MKEYDKDIPKEINYTDLILVKHNKAHEDFRLVFDKDEQKYIFNHRIPIKNARLMANLGFVIFKHLDHISISIPTARIHKKQEDDIYYYYYRRFWDDQAKIIESIIGEPENIDPLLVRYFNDKTLAGIMNRNDRHTASVKVDDKMVEVSKLGDLFKYITKENKYEVTVEID